MLVPKLVELLVGPKDELFGVGVGVGVGLFCDPKEELFVLPNADAVELFELLVPNADPAELFELLVPKADPPELPVLLVPKADPF